MEEVIEVLITFLFTLNVAFGSIRVFGIFDTIESWIASGAEFFEYLFGGSHKGMILEKRRAG